MWLKVVMDGKNVTSVPVRGLPVSSRIGASPVTSSDLTVSPRSKRISWRLPLR